MPNMLSWKLLWTDINYVTIREMILAESYIEKENLNKPIVIIQLII